MSKLNWRSIERDGYPSDPYATYLVTDGKEIATTEVSGTIHFKKNEPRIFVFKEWSGDPNTSEYNDCCSGERTFELTPTHWVPVSEINLPKI